MMYFSIAVLILAITSINGNEIETDNSEICDPTMVTFELVTGYVFTSPDDTMATMTGVLQLTDCLNACKSNITCKSINFETGLCILLRSSATDKPGSFTSSQFPVFTIYAEKSCLKGLEQRPCGSSWAFERVIGYELRGQERKRVQVASKFECLQSCIIETLFECRSVNYDNLTGECSLSDMDRHSIPATAPKNHFSPSSSPTQTSDYYESNCVAEPRALCDFRPIKGKMLKTVDSIHQNIKSVEECEKQCLESNYRCFSYDFGDPQEGKICRTSHLETASLTHIEEPYLANPDAITYEKVTCYRVDILCRAREMVAHIKTSKLFSGKVYAKSKPNSCVNDVTSSLEFEIVMPFHDIMCNVKQKDQGKFTNDIIIQHHDMVVTTKDIGFSVNCHYDLSNKSVSNHQPILIDSALDTREEQNVHSAIVGAPNVTMKITDKNGSDITSAQVGDQLLLKLQITDEQSPYQIFVRELVAVDGVDSSDIVLIDSVGCPTDVNIMGFVTKLQDSKGVPYLEIPFDAFKFPTSDVVQFRALVTPCLTACDPVFCVAQSYDGKIQEMNSYGKRRRRALLKDKKETEEEMVITQSIRINDAFGFKEKDNIDQDYNFYKITEEVDGKLSPCINMTGLAVACIVFLLIQMVLMSLWVLCWYKKTRKSYGKQVPPVYSYSGSMNDNMRYAPSFVSSGRD